MVGRKYWKCHECSQKSDTSSPLCGGCGTSQSSSDRANTEAKKKKRLQKQKRYIDKLESLLPVRFDEQTQNDVQMTVRSESGQVDFIELESTTPQNVRAVDDIDASHLIRLSRQISPASSRPKKWGPAFTTTKRPKKSITPLEKTSGSPTSSSESDEQYIMRLKDFKYAREKRRQAYGQENPWGILGLFEHLSSIRTDIDWADEVARRRQGKEPYIPWSEYDDLKDTDLKKPLFTYSLIAICTLTMIYAMKLSGWKMERLTLNPMLGPPAEILIQIGAKYSPLIVDNNELWRVITPMFLHAGWIHYFVNIIALRAIGTAVEQTHGSLAALILFCVPSVGGTVLSAVFLPEFISVGASGGIFGYIGACLADIFMNWSLIFGDELNDKQDTCSHIWMVVWLLLDVSVNCFIGLTPFIDNFTHMGGMFYGFLCGIALMDRIRLEKTAKPSLHPQTKPQHSRHILIIFLTVTTGIVASMTVLMTGDGATSPIPSAKNWSCVSFPPWNDKYNKWWYCDNCGQTSADARVSDDDGNENYYDELNLHCPDGTDVEIGLEDYATNDKGNVEDMLPNLCREYCENIYF